MAIVRFPRHLTNQFSVPPTCEASGATVAEVVADLERQYPGLAAYLVDEQGAVRKHVKLFIAGQWIADRERLSDLIQPSDEILVVQALSGG